MSANQIRELLATAAARRLEVSKQWPTMEDVKGLHPSIKNVALMVKDRQLLAVYCEGEGKYRFPKWQFDFEGQPVSYMKSILTILRDQGPFGEIDGRTTGWGDVEWFLSGHALLDGLSPSEVLVSDPLRVLTAAQEEFSTSDV